MRWPGISTNDDNVDRSRSFQLLSGSSSQLQGEPKGPQEERADRSGLFRTYMSRIESGRANPTLTMLHQIAAAFGVDVRELLVPSDGPVPDRVLSARPLSRGRVRP
jgi:transcriptional regulator with XRE-family HTH domain